MAELAAGGQVMDAAHAALLLLVVGFFLSVMFDK